MEQEKQVCAAPHRLRGVGTGSGLQDCPALSAGDRGADGRRCHRTQKAQAALWRAPGKRRVTGMHVRLAHRRHACHPAFSARMARYRPLLRNQPVARRCDDDINKRVTLPRCAQRGTLPGTGRYGVVHSDIRQETQSNCGRDHDRDTKAAKTILRCPRDTGTGIPVCSGGATSKPGIFLRSATSTAGTMLPVHRRRRACSGSQNSVAEQNLIVSCHNRVTVSVNGPGPGLRGDRRAMRGFVAWHSCYSAGRDGDTVTDTGPVIRIASRSAVSVSPAVASERCRQQAPCPFRLSGSSLPWNRGALRWTPPARGRYTHRSRSQGNVWLSPDCIRSAIPRRRRHRLHAQRAATADCAAWTSAVSAGRFGGKFRR